MTQIKNFIITGIILLMAAGCKNEKQEEPVEKKAEPAIQVVVDMVVKKDDVFQLFYTEDGSINFGPHFVSANVKGQTEGQQITFNLPDNAILGNLRIDMGQNEAQDEMTMNKFIIRIRDKELVLGAADFFKYFSPTDNIKANPEKFSFKGVRAYDTYDPLYYGNYYLIEDLKKLNK